MRLSDIIDKLRLLTCYPQTGSIETGDEGHTCVNCGLYYKGNFCPACGQKATAGRITWGTVRSGVMDVWGLGSRSLIRSLWQLVVRPGRLISDYINGKWQVSFPPVKMLVIVAIFLYFLGRLLYPEFWGDLFEDDMATPANMLEEAISWVVSHPEWAFLSVLSLLVIPTWLVFRHAPRNTRHTLPQGFFIMVFLCVQFYLWLFVFSFVFKMFDIGQDLGFTIAFVFVIPVLVLIDYKSLFGYGWWGTLWRIVAVFELAYLGIVLLVYISRLFDEFFSSTGYNQALMFLTIIFFLAASAVLLVFVIDMINRRSWRTVGWLKALKYPLIMFGVVLTVMILGELISPGSFSKLPGLLFPQ